MEDLKVLKYFEMFFLGATHPGAENKGLGWYVWVWWLSAATTAMAPALPALPRL